MQYGITIGFIGGQEATAFPVTREVQESELAAVADLLRKSPQDRACCRVIASDEVSADGVRPVPRLVYDPRVVAYAMPRFMRPIGDSA